MRFNVVYHVAVINHWHRVVREQVPILLRNRDIATITVTIAATHNEFGGFAAQQVTDVIGAVNSSVPVRTVLCALEDFEHPAMVLIDELVRNDDRPVLYFHAKGVSYSRPDIRCEAWRRYLNEFVAEADQWAEFLVHNDYDACGRLLMSDPQHGFRYFAGNFWMAKGSYLKSLPSYEDFIQEPDLPYCRPKDRTLAEGSVNRAKRMKPLSTDGTDLTLPAFRTFIYDLLLREEAGRINKNQAAAPVQPLEKRYSLDVFELPWPQVLDWYSAISGLPYVGKVQPAGTLTVIAPEAPKRLYTVNEITDVLNNHLLSQKLLLFRSSFAYTLAPADQQIDAAFVPRVALDQLDKCAMTDLVTVLVSLNTLETEPFAESAKKILEPNGQVVVLEKRNQLILQGLASKLAVVVQLVNKIDGEPVKKK